MVKEEDSSNHDTTSNEKLSKKELFNFQDEKFKKAFNKYYRWKFSLYNEKNLPVSGGVVMKYNHEFMQTCILLTQELTASGHQTANKKNRIQSAHSRLAFNHVVN